ncbi:TrkH-domain-containing protein [Daldinia vernicosa]|uniref:TrkH-domain-containing protein n=1 Tax=Daldinia vernicosa TaxID=114800 RepID=UPI0020082216|nr:TrkH-domain-containing protein [Daldinia vernicosa]KAI0849676.1 TrkH-domain-containing protein [Daldinia vernicosa]
MGIQWWDDFGDKHPKVHDTLTNAAYAIRPYLPPVNYITLHYAYFIGTTIVATLIFWGASAPKYSVGWWDSMFMVMSALTASGLNTVNVSQLTTFQQVELCVLMMIGSQVLISYVTIAFRKHIFEKRFEDIVKMEREKRKKKVSGTGAIVGMTGAMFGLQVMSSFGKGRAGEKARPTSHVRNLSSSTRRQVLAEEGTIPEIDVENARGQQQQHHVGFLEPVQEGKSLEGGHSATTAHSIYQTQSHQSGATRRRSGTVESKTAFEGFNVQTFLTEQKRNIGRNGQFFNLSEDQREYLGGVEYRSLKFLSVFVLVYFVLCQFFGAIALGAWMSVYAVDTAAVNAQNPWWAGIFLAISSYNNAGFTLLDAGFIPFQSSYFLLVVVTLLSLAGPAAFPVFMRFIIWSMSTLLNLLSKDKEYGVWKEGFDFILKFPRRVYTSLFPAKDTWMFAATFGAFVIVDWVLILLLSIGNPTMDAIPIGQRIFDALFQGFSIPSGGYAIVSPSAMYFDILVLWLVVYYTAAYPHIITMRNSNVYEERSLGIYEGDQPEEEQLHSASSSIVEEDAANILDETGLQPATTNNNKNWDAVSRAPTAKSVKMLVSVGRRGTAFVGRQLQRRMTAFQGVGVAAPAPAPAIKPLSRAKTIDFGRASVHSLHNHPPAGPPSLVSQQVRGQLSHDVWWIALMLFFITLIETSHSLADPVSYSVFNILFEIVSGYTNIGISIGLPDQSYSLSGGMHTGSKIIMILVMLRGRHRGLPVALDRAIRLPGKKLAEYEEEDAEIRSMSAFSR